MKNTKVKIRLVEPIYHDDYKRLQPNRILLTSDGTCRTIASLHPQPDLPPNQALVKFKGGHVCELKDTRFPLACHEDVRISIIPKPNQYKLAFENRDKLVEATIVKTSIDELVTYGTCVKIVPIKIVPIKKDNI